MPDSFFSSNKTRKRKRTGPTPEGRSARPNKKTTRSEPSSSSKRTSGPWKGKAAPKKTRRDEELNSDRTDDEGGVDIDDMDLRAVSDEEGSGDEFADETPAEKRLRLAKLYLESVKEGLADGEYDAAEIDREVIAARLKQDVLEHSGKVHLFIADSFDFTPPTTMLKTKGHRFTVTSAVVSDSAKFLFTSGKEGSIIKWDIASGKRLVTLHKVRPPKPENGKGKGKASAGGEIKGHTDEVLALAISSDGKYLASAGKDRRLGVWDAEKAEWIRGFIGPMCHKDLISCLSFRKGTHQLFTGSFDRTIKLFDLSPSVMGYVETLYGHQDHIISLDTLRGENCVSVGARDKTVRYWKIVEETQLVFRGGGKSKIREVLEGGLKGDDDGDENEDMDVDGAASGRPEAKGKGKQKEQPKKFVEGSLECVAMLDETTFVSGGDSGSICLWTTQRKKPVFTQPLAHGLNEAQSETEGVIQTPRWITSLASLRYSDLFASGSWEGDVRIWKLDPKLKSFSLVGQIPVQGVINSLQFLTPPTDFRAVAAWASQPEQNAVAQLNGASSVPSRTKIGVPETILLVAGFGHEHRMGRWLTVKGNGAYNGALVIAFHSRTTTGSS
ncbi:hypothetical protein HGRIS_012522 [Hohenbuehelia grisea]|uniref:WD40 repeat-like protein n=1 Tax=Hohenbuehelia grisea TaxID=104357 RepID=A0ABR3ISH1_9AGAR